MASEGKLTDSGTAPMKKSALKKKKVAGHDHDGSRESLCQAVAVVAKASSRPAATGLLVQPFSEDTRIF